MNTRNTKTKLLIGLSLLTAVLCGCTPTPKETKADDAQSVVDAIKYVKAKNGLCFGVVTVERISTNGSLAVNQMVVPAECARVGF